MDYIGLSAVIPPSLAQYADIGFAVLVGGICLRTLLFDREANIKQRAIWKHELLELEKSLKQLILEASAASEAFDAQLNNRQKAIEKLAEKAETLLKTSISNAIKTRPSFKKARSDNQLDVRPEVKVETRPAIERESKEDWVYGDELPTHLPDPFEKLAKETEDRVELKKEPNKLLKQSNKTKTVTEDEIAEKEALTDEKIFSQTSIVDPVTFRIAKRLLLEGKELHIIARKLEMPVSEIRHLEILIRQQAQADEIELPETFKAREIETVSKVIRDRGGKGAKQKTLVQQIETLNGNSRAQSLSFEDEIDLSNTFIR